MALLREEHDQRGQTIVLVTHDARVAARADRVITMRDGSIADETRLVEGRTTSRTVARLLQLEVLTRMRHAAAFAVSRARRSLSSRPVQTIAGRVRRSSPPPRRPW